MLDDMLLDDMLPLELCDDDDDDSDSDADCDEWRERDEA